ncbi:MAG: type II toxin-antitoxin system RelE/ParE family toxin [Oscillospiraceae bacterium]|nr:type II toxin-antitoxin system RelE/ParE family toxin [Oscillospiraceae bacterium]
MSELYNVVVAPAANDRMAEHFEFLARVSIEAANNLLEKLTCDINSLQTLPFRNPVFDRPFVTPQKYRHMLSNKRYRIVYQVVGDTVFVDDIQDCRQDSDKNLVN